MANGYAVSLEQRAGRIASSEPDSQWVRSPKGLPMPGHGVVVFEGRHAPAFMGQRKDRYAKFYLVLKGRAQWVVGEKQYHVRPNTLFHVAPGLKHSQKDRADALVTLYAIQYEPECLVPELRDDLFRIGMLPLKANSRDAGQLRHVRSIFEEMLFEQEARQKGWPMALRARLIDLAVLTVRLAQRLVSGEPVFQRGNQSAERVANYAARLKSQFLQPTTIAEAARSVSLSRRQFTEVFRHVTGETFRQRVLGLRMEYALKLLLQTDKSITEIAFESGFDELSHFHHVFKEQFGDSPAHWRLNHRQNRQFAPA